VTGFLGVSTLFDTTLVDEASQLWMLEDEAFVSSALRILVDKALEPETQFRFVWLLRQGYSKHFVLARMADQWGALFRPGKLPGMRRRLNRYRLTRLPILGGLMRLIFNLPSESLGPRRLRVIENQLYLLAKNEHDARPGIGLAAAPWGGLHRGPLLQKMFDAEADMTPAVKSTYRALMNAASAGAVSKPEA
jgi:hypothetical protein